MNAFLIISSLLLAAAAYALYRWNRKPSDEDPRPYFAPQRAVRLFDAPDAASESESAHHTLTPEQRASLVARARQGEIAALDEAQTSGQADCYSEVLDALIEEAAGDDEKLRAIAAHIAASDQLRASARLAEVLISVCERTPSRSALTEMLHIAALTDDAAVFQKATEAALAHWRQGRSQMTAEKLHLLIESQYWTLAPEARRSGAGFILKRSLIRARRELAAAARRAAT